MRNGSTAVAIAQNLPHFSEYSFPTRYIIGIARKDGKTEVKRKTKSEHCANGFKYR